MWSKVLLTSIKKHFGAFLLLGLFVIGASSTSVTSIPLSSVSDLLIQSALDSLNENSPTHHTYKSGNLISAQKLDEAPYVIYKLTLNLEANCNEESTCPREACAIDLRQHEEGVIDVEKSSIQCMYLHPQSSQDEINQNVQENVQDKTETVQQDAATDSMLELDHEVETVIKNGSERPFIAVRATDKNYCAGCPYELNPTLPGLAAFGEQVVQKMDDSGRSDFKHKVVSIVRVTRAVPPGSNVVKYELNLEIGETNCPKTSLIKRSECNLLPNIPIKLCLVNFEERPWQENSRKITGNNCTDLPDSDNELNGSYSQSLPVSESLTASSIWSDEASPNFDSSVKQFNDVTTAEAITEDSIKKIVLSTENVEDQKIIGFTDKIKEFDAFLEDFDIPIKNPTPEPENHGLPVNEELIRPEVVQRTSRPILQRDERNSEAMVDQRSNGRIRRSLVDTSKSEKGFVRELAQKAINVLDDIDVDNNKRIVLGVLESKKEEIHDGAVYHVTIKVVGTNCNEDQYKNIDECLERVREPTKVCKVQIHTDNEATVASAKILQLQCHPEEKYREIVRFRREQIPGGPIKKNIDDPEIRDYAKKGLSKFSEISDSENEPFLVEIVEATAQVVAGMLYKIKVRLGESTCQKGNKENCQLKEESDVNDYLITVWSQPWVDNGNPKIEVESQSNSTHGQRVRRSETLVGGATAKDPNDPEIKGYVDKGLEKFSATSDSENEPFLVEIVEATAQVVSGMLYKIKVRLGESTCQKGNKENCQLKEKSDVNDYLISVWSQPWVDNGNPKIEVESQRNNNHVQRLGRSVRRLGGATAKDPNDPEIKGYVDKGLEKFSATSDSENEPFLVEIVEATAQVVSGMLYKIKVRLGESTCQKGNKENCQLKEESDVNDYLITVWSQPWVDNGNPKIEVESQRNNNHVQRLGRSVRRLGGATAKDPNDPEIKGYVDKGLEKFSATSDSENEPFLVEIVEATAQVVSGMLYKIKVRLGESTCQKGNKENCQLKEESDVNDYLITVWSQPWIDNGNPDIKVEPQSNDIHVKKVRRSETRPGGVTTKDPNDPEIKGYVDKGLENFSATSNSENEPFLVEIVEATAQVVSGMLYKIKVRLGESTCQKGNKENCQLKEESDVNDYLITVWSKPWIDNGKPDIKIEQKRAGRIQRETSINVGEPTKISPDDPQIKKYAQRGVGVFSNSFDGPYEHLLAEITEAYVQIVSGELYTIKVKLGESNCPKGTNQDCKLKPNGETKDCIITVWSQPWLDKENPDVNVNCTKNSLIIRKKKSLRGLNYNAKMLNLAKDLKLEKDFQNFITKYEKIYSSEDEKKARFEIFKSNMKIAEKLREKEQGTAIYGASIFADIAPQEFRTKYLGLKPQLRLDNQIPFPQAQIPDIKLPQEFDWRHYNVVTEVKNQQSCGSCWAFSVTGNVEGQYAIKTGRLLSLSEQELVDCDTLDQGCEGGLPDNAYRAIETLGGLELETDYPYDARDEKCNFDKSKAKVNVVSGLNITTDETGMAQWLVKNGPISIGINANAMQLYMGGVSHPWKFLCNPKNLDHGVLIVGYGVHTYPIFKKTMPYWIIKNSWGPSWGEQGYYRVYRGDGTCGLNMMASSAVLA